MENKKGKFVQWLFGAFVLEFVLCHMCAVVAETESYVVSIVEFGFLEHIKVAPFDLFYFDMYVYLFGWLFFFIVFFMAQSKVELPKADMKGTEHGSSHFMTDIEKKEFLKTCTTPILRDEDIKPVVVGKKAGEENGGT